jgi:glycosyltransferase involved in cell wall biosynthesis
MKVGLCVIDVPETLGGGFVLRDDVARAAKAANRRHQFKLLRAIPAAMKTMRREAPESLQGIGDDGHFPIKLRHLKHLFTPRRAAILLLRRELKAILHSQVKSNWVFEHDVEPGSVEILWFNHVEPIDVGLPYILNIFDLQHRLQPWFPEVSANGEWDHRELSWATAIRRAWVLTVGSEEAKEQLSFFYDVPLDRIKVVPFPTPQRALDFASDESRVTPVDVRAKYGISGDFIFYPAQFWPHKNHANLLRALRVLRVNHKIDLSLVLAGSDRGNMDHVRNVIDELGLKGHVHVLGFVPPEDLVALYRSALALTYVSYFGPENLPPLEALALGCPIVLADITGVRKLFGEGPVLVDPSDEVAIAAGIRRLYDHPELRQRYLESGRAIASRNSAEHYVEQIELVLDELESVRRCWPSKVST